MIAPQVHIIAFDVPYPPDYGGVIDIFYKIKALYESGIAVHLHCFEYGRNPASELEEYCKTVHYYKRQLGLKNAISKLPYIVNSRKSEELLNRLTEDSFPILFEGLHSTYYLASECLAGRKKIVRTHNIEHNYYAGLALAEKQGFKKTYYKRESSRLKNYQEVLKHADGIATISKNDFTYFNGLFNNAFYIPAFHPDNEVASLSEQGDYILYHANLSVSENVSACMHLIKEVFSKIRIPVKLAGKNPDNKISEAISPFEHIALIPNPDQNQMDKLIRDAHIVALYTSQDTGLKLKLLSSLHNSRHCLVNSLMVKNTGLENLCSIADSAEKMVSEIQFLMQIPFDRGKKEERQTVLLREYSNKISADLLVKMLF